MCFFNLHLFFFLCRQGRVQDRDCLCPLHPVGLPVPHGHPTQKAAPVPLRPVVPLPSSLLPESSLVYRLERKIKVWPKHHQAGFYLCLRLVLLQGGDGCLNPPPLCWVPSPLAHHKRTAAWGRSARQERRAEPCCWLWQRPGGARGCRALSRLQHARARGRRRQSRYLFSSSCRKVQPEAGEPFN